MGNFVFLPSLNSKTKLFKNSTDDILANTTATEEKPDDYRVHYDASSDMDSSVWVNIKNRQKRKKDSNKIRTTRYNPLTFLPKNLFEQFHRVANIYFAILIALNWIPVINAISKTVTHHIEYEFPLKFFV